MDLILFLKLVRDDALRSGIGIWCCIRMHLSNKKERDLGTANAPLADDRNVRLLFSATGFSKSVIFTVSCYCPRFRTEKCECMRAV